MPAKPTTPGADQTREVTASTVKTVSKRVGIGRDGLQYRELDPLSKYDTFVYDDEGRYLSYVCTFSVNTALSGTRSYTYDTKGRLTGETFTPLNLDTTYSFDTAGNHFDAFHGATLTVPPPLTVIRKSHKSRFKTPQTPA